MTDKDKEKTTNFTNCNILTRISREIHFTCWTWHDSTAQVCMCDDINAFNFWMKMQWLKVTSLCFWVACTNTHKLVKVRLMCCQSKTPSAEKITLPQPLPCTWEWKCIWKLFFSNLLLFKQIVNYWIPKPGCSLTLFMVQWIERAQWTN